MLPQELPHVLPPRRAMLLSIPTTCIFIQLLIFGFQPSGCRSLAQSTPSIICPSASTPLSEFQFNNPYFHSFFTSAIPLSITTVKVSNLSLGASDRDIQEFFSFSGEIQYVEMRSDTERSQIAFVTFKDAQGAETAVLLSGATIVDMTVDINLDPDYKLPPSASALLLPSERKNRGGAESAFQKAEDIVSSMLAKGFILGKDALNKAKSFDDKLQLTSTASATVASFDRKIGLTEKINMGTSIVNDKVREVDEKLQVSEKVKSALAAAEQTVGSAGSAMMKNRYVLTGTTWVTGAFNKVTKAAGEVGQKTKDKVGVVEDEQRRKNVG